jgi:predicted AlkP superfamily pyrophosphatase or phosphodiesterase
VLLKRIVAAVTLAACLPAVSNAGPFVAARPRLVVLISIDQFRADYLTRFEDLFLAPRAGNRVGGFRYLMERGAYYPDAHHDHIPLATGPGHSIHFTGAPPYKSGIIANDWYDRNEKRDVYCVQDDAQTLVPKPPNWDTLRVKGVSPMTLRVTTVGDELKMATGGKGKVFGIALKDRAAVLMAGHLADAVYWFDDAGGGWQSSLYYRKDGTLPSWVKTLNADAAHNASSYTGKEWTLSPNVTPEALQRLWVPAGKDRSTYPGTFADDLIWSRKGFPRKLPATSTGGRPYLAFTNTPFANEFVLQSAAKLIQEEGLGRDDTPDVLAVNLSSNDYIGHAFGPDSAEVLDVTVKTDSFLSGFFNELDKLVPGGIANVTIVVTADHGAPPNPILMRDSGIRGGAWSSTSVEKPAEEALRAAFPPAPGETDRWVLHYLEPYLWLDQETIKRRGVPIEQVRQIAADAVTKAPGIYAVYTREQILSGALPRTDIAKHVTLGYHPLLSGDLLIVSQPFWQPRPTERGVTHAEPYSYDTRVPLLMAGSGVRAGTYTERVSTLDIAPTLSFLLHVAQPSGCEGRILSRAMSGDGPVR